MVREMTSYSYCAALRALRPGFYPVFREQSGCSPSVVAVVGRCNGIMSNPNANPYQPQPQPGPQKNKTSRRFFTWVRSSGLVRGDDRWIGGVCSGIALRLGWSPTLVRALVIVCTLFFGFGAALYALGWFLMPDVRDGHILAEDLIAGQWDWNCLGCFLFLAVAIVIPGAGWGLYCARRLSAMAVGQKRHSPAGRVRIRGICAATGFTACVISSSTACLISSRATSTSISFVFSSATFSTTCFTTCFTNRA